MFIQLCDKTIFSSLFSPSCTALELNNSIQKKYWGGGNEFRGTKLRDGVNFHNFREFAFAI